MSEGYGWCRGVILEQVPNRTRKVGGVQVNFIAKFYIDEFSTDLALEANDYDTSYSAGYESWMLLESSEQPTAIDGRWAHVRSRGCSRAGAVCICTMLSGVHFAMCV